MNVTVSSFYIPPHDYIGAGVQMHMLANAYAKLGHDVTLISPQLASLSDSRYAYRSLRVTAPMAVIKWSLMLSRTSFLPGLVHFGGDNHLVGKRKSTVRLRTFHGSCFAEAAIAPRAFDKVRMTYLGLTELVGQMNCDVSTAVSIDTNNYFPRDNIVIPNGVDLDTFKPLGSKSKNPSILFVGMLDSRKRGRELVEAFATTVRPLLPTAELWIVRETEDCGVPGVKTFGRVSESELVRMYQEAWCFCLPSIYEGFGVPYIESMACGTPVVATPNPGSLEVTKSGEFGVVTPLDDLGKTLVELLLDKDRRDRLTESSLAHVQSYDIMNVARRYIDLAWETGIL